MLNDTLSNALSLIYNGEMIRRESITINPNSKVISKVLDIFNAHGYVGKAENITDSKGGFAKIPLLGHINKCGVIKPRFSVKKDQYEKFEKRYLPAKNMGIMIVTTSQGMMTHDEAKEKNIGGKLIAYCY